jgi:NADPH:quinone reductase-like Zn-dependent oxidoreductase
VLKQAGFSGSEIVFHDYNDHTRHDTSVIVSTAVDKIPLNPSNSRLILIHNAEQKNLAFKVQAALQDDFIIQLAAIEQASEETIEPNAVIVVLSELNQPILSNMYSPLFENIHNLLTRKSKILWVSRGGTIGSPVSQFHLKEGLLRVLNSEFEIGFAYLSLESQGNLNKQQIGHIANVSKMILRSKETDTEYVEQNGVLNIPRVTDCDRLNKAVHERQLTHKKGQTKFGSGVPLRVTIGSPGLLNTLHFVEDKEQKLELQPNEIEIQVQSVGINFRDILIALGRLDQHGIGTECAGIVTRLGSNCKGFQIGSRVATCSGSCQSFVRVDYHCVAKIPDGMSFSTAAAVTINHSTSWHSLVEVARVQPGEIVLIHSGAGGTGQAAIQIAQYLGATVMATVGSKEKMQLLVDQYNIPREFIFSSRNTLFAKSIKRLTSGRGVDVVLNSLSGEGLAASWECIAPYGRFIEIGKKDIFSHNTLQMYHFARNVTFSAVDLSTMNTERPELVLKSLNAILSLVAKGELTPSRPMQVYGVSEVEKAFRSMQSGKNSGKIVIEMRANEYVEVRT